MSYLWLDFSCDVYSTHKSFFFCHLSFCSRVTAENLRWAEVKFCLPFTHTPVTLADSTSIFWVSVNPRALAINHNLSPHMIQSRVMSFPWLFSVTSAISGIGVLKGWRRRQGVSQEVNYLVTLSDLIVFQCWFIIVSNNETHLSLKVVYFGGD